MLYFCYSWRNEFNKLELCDDLDINKSHYRKKKMFIAQRQVRKAII